MNSRIASRMTSKEAFKWFVYYFSKLMRELGFSVFDKVFLKQLWLLTKGSKLNLKSPKTFNEKLQWLKIYYRRPELTTMVDKYSVKEYVASKIGIQYVAKLLGVWDRPEDIDLNSLPTKFVLKTTFGGGGYIIICKDKQSFDLPKAISKLKSQMKLNLYMDLCEWPYKNVKKRIIAEELLEPDNEDQQITDFKFFCFNGEPKIMYISDDGAAEPHTDFYDMQGRHLNLQMRDPNSINVPSLPDTFEEMKILAAKLSENIPFVRVDFYNSKGCVYFGELTFFPCGGFAPFYPKEWETTFGNWLKLPCTQ